MVNYVRDRSEDKVEFQKRLGEFGKHVGARMLDVVVMREHSFKRDTRIRQILHFIKGPFWKNLFGKEAEELHKSMEKENIYYLIEQEPLMNRFIGSEHNCAAFNGGVISGALNNAGFACQVTTALIEGNKGTAHEICFEDHVLARDKALENTR